MKLVNTYVLLVANWLKRKTMMRVLLYVKSKMVLSDVEKVELAHHQNALDEVYKQKSEGAFIQSRKRWIEEDWKDNKWKNNLIGKLMEFSVKTKKSLLFFEPNSITIYI